MEQTSNRTISTVGYAVGTGIVGIALAGIPLQFLVPDMGTWATYGSTFVAGGLIGAAIAVVRDRRA